jgi:two-component system, OmpR family, sensor kinase
MSRIPIRLRVTLAFAAAMLVVLALTAGFVYERVEDRLNESLDEGLQARADDVAALVATGGGEAGTLRLDQQRVLETEDAFAQVLRTDGLPGRPSAVDGQLVATTLPESGGTVLNREEADRAGAGPVFVTRRVPGIPADARILARPVTASDRVSIVVVGTTTEDRDETLSGLLTTFAIGGPIALLLASVLGYLVAGRALTPVEAMRRRAAMISAAEPDERLPVPKADDEIRRLGETLNGMLGRLEAAIERERAFVDDASHELRTPLAMHKTELELALRYAKTPDEMRAAMSSAIVEVDRLIQLAEDLLVLARSQEGRLALDLRRVGVADLLADLRERFSARIDDEGRLLVIEPADGLTVEGDRLRLEQALTNLVENAIEHGGGDITVRASEAPGEVAIHVEDHGPGFAPEFIGRAFERFSQEDPSRGGDGTGLGLAIVAAIARAHRGSAHAANREGSGADVWIELPADRA